MQRYTATVGRRNPVSNRMLLYKVHREDGTLFRDHNWIVISKQLDQVRLGDTITFLAKEAEYLSSEGTKIGLKKLRDVEISEEAN